MGKIMVTGALGNVGGHVARQAIAGGETVVCADIDPAALDSRFGANASCVRFDFTDSSTFAGALEGVDRVFIMRPPHLGRPQDLYPFITALKAKGDIRLVCFLSLIGIEHNPVPPHYRIEKAIERAGLPFCHIRPSFFMQNISGVHAFEIRHFNQIFVPVGNARTSFIDAEDIGAITARILSEPARHAGRGYAITGPEAIDYHDAAKILSEELARTIAYARPSPRLAKRYWIDIRGLDRTYAAVMGMLYMMTRMGTANRVTGTFEAVMGRQPQTFRQFVRKNRAAWQ